MTWFKVDDGMHSHIKAMRAGVEAVGLWTLAGSWCAYHLTDGWVPDYAVTRWAVNGPELAERLVHAGLWIVAEKDGDTGWRFHQWTERQPTRNQIELERNWNARRAALYRDPVLLDAIRARDRNRCRYCGTLVDWKDRRGATGGTYDLVDPRGPSALVNVVTACRKCNTAKDNRSLSDASGMALIPPESLGPDQIVTSDEPEPDQTGPKPEPDPSSNTTGAVSVNYNSPTRPDPTRPVRDKKALLSAAPPRDEVRELCLRLRDRIVDNGCKPPTVGAKWFDAARLLLDQDHRTVDEVRTLIDWCQADPFWRTNILSMPTFRAKFDQLRLKADSERKTSGGSIRRELKRDPKSGLLLDWT